MLEKEALSMMINTTDHLDVCLAHFPPGGTGDVMTTVAPSPWVTLYYCHPAKLICQQNTDCLL